MHLSWAKKGAVQPKCRTLRVAFAPCGFRKCSVLARVSTTNDGPKADVFLQLFNQSLHFIFHIQMILNAIYHVIYIYIYMPDIYMCISTPHKGLQPLGLKRGALLVADRAIFTRLQCETGAGAQEWPLKCYTSAMNKF